MTDEKEPQDEIPTIFDAPQEAPADETALDQALSEIEARYADDETAPSEPKAKAPKEDQAEEGEEGTEDADEYEQAANELRRAGFSNRTLKAMSQRDVVAEAAKVQRVRAKTEASYQELNRKYLQLLEEKGAGREEAGHAEPTQPSEGLHESLQAFAREYLGEGAEEPFLKAIEAIVEPLQRQVQEQRELLEGQQAGRLQEILNANQRRLAKAYPRLKENPKLFERLTRVVDATILEDPDAYTSVDDVFDEVAADFFGEGEPKSKAPDRAARRNGQPSSNGAKTPSTKTRDQREDAALAALEEFSDPVRARQAFLM